MEETFRDAAKTAPKRPKIFPALEFVNKAPSHGKECQTHPNCDWQEEILQFTEDEPRRYEHPDGLAQCPEGQDPKTWQRPTAISYSINATRILKNKEPEGINLRMPLDKAHTLTNGVMALYDNHAALQGVKIRIVVYGYPHKGKGDFKGGAGTKGYRVEEIAGDTPAILP